jgi:hypothetical protein
MPILEHAAKTVFSPFIDRFSPFSRRAEFENLSVNQGSDRFPRSSPPLKNGENGKNGQPSRRFNG